MTGEIDTEVFLSQCVRNGITNMCVKSYLEIRKWWYKEYDFNGGHVYSITRVILYYDIEMHHIVTRVTESVLSQ